MEDDIEAIQDIVEQTTTCNRVAAEPPSYPVDSEIFKSKHDHALLKRKRVANDLEHEDEAPGHAVRLGTTLTKSVIPATFVQGNLEDSMQLATACLVGVNNVLFAADTVVNTLLKGHRHFRTTLNVGQGEEDEDAAAMECLGQLDDKTRLQSGFHVSCYNAFSDNKSV